MNIEWVNRDKQVTHLSSNRIADKFACLLSKLMNRSGIVSGREYAQMIIIITPRGVANVRWCASVSPSLEIVCNVTILCRHSYFRSFRWRCSYGKPWKSRATEVPASTQKVSQNCATLYNKYNTKHEGRLREQQLKRGNDWRIVRNREDNFAHKSQTSWPLGWGVGKGKGRGGRWLFTLDCRLSARADN